MHTNRFSSISTIAFMAADSDTGAGAADGTAAPVAVSANKPLTILTDESKVKALKEVMADRELFDNLDAAMAKLGEIAEKTTPKLADGTVDPEGVPFYGLPYVIKGTKDDGSIDESIYAGQRASLSYVGAKLAKATGIKGIVILPIPQLDAFVASDTGKAFLDKVAIKEMHHVAFRQFRDASTLYEFESGVGGVPSNAEDYATESRRGVDTDTFDTMWNGFRTMLKSKMPALHDLLPNKKDFLDSLRSKSFALSNPETTKPLEDGGWFVKLGQMLVKTAENWKDDKGVATPLETDTLKSWIAGRDELTLEREQAKPKDFSVLSSMSLDF